MEPIERVHRSRKKMIADNFIGGISWSIGVWIGTTLVIALIVFLLSKANYIPFIGDFISQIVNYVSHTNPRL